jgi:restriction system protein
MPSKCGEVREFQTVKGLERFEVEVSHHGLGKHQVIRGDNRHVVVLSAQARMRQWDKMWERREAAESKRQQRRQRAEEVQDKKALAADRTDEAEEALDAAHALLKHALNVNDAVDWERLKTTSDYSVPQPVKPDPPAKPVQPQRGPEPLPEHFPARLGLLGRLLRSKRAEREREARALYESALQAWKDDWSAAVATHNSQVREFNEAIKLIAEQHSRDVAEWQGWRAENLKRRDEANSAVERRR